MIAVGTGETARGLAGFGRDRPVLFTLHPVEADQAGAGVTTEQELENLAPEIDDLRGFGFDDHAGRGRRGAGWREPAQSFNLDYAKAASAVRFKGRVRAQCRDADTSLLGGFKHRITLFGPDFHAIYRKRDFTH